METWTYYNPVRVEFGRDYAEVLAKHVPDGRVLILSTKGNTKRGTNKIITHAIGEERVIIRDSIRSNPDIDDLDRTIYELRSEGVTSIIAIGGGSVIDAGKILGVCLPVDNKNTLDRILRGGLRQNWSNHIPVFAVPTTSGTGAEITPFATVWDNYYMRKYSIVGESVYPCEAILDPALTLTLPYEETLYTGLDTFSHSLESFWSKSRTTISLQFAISALRLAVEAFQTVLNIPDDLEGRAKMQKAALLAGLAISQGKTAVAHAISYPLTLHFGIPHGLACSFTLTSILSLPGIDSCFPLEQSNLISKVISILESLKMKERLLPYANLKEIYKLVPEMNTKGRGDNFQIEVTESLIVRILKNSIGY